MKLGLLIEPVQNLLDLQAYIQKKATSSSTNIVKISERISDSLGKKTHRNIGPQRKFTS